MSANKKRVEFNNKEKLQVIEQYDKLNNVTQKEAAAQFGIAQSSLSKLLKYRHEISNSEFSESRKRKRTGKNKKVDDVLFLWFKQALILEEPISSKILMEKANEYAKQLDEDFVASTGWLTRWKRRHCIVDNKIQYGMDDDDEGGKRISNVQLQDALEVVRKALQQRGCVDYSDFYNVEDFLNRFSNCTATRINDNSHQE